LIAKVRGNSKIEGEITVSGAKNSALPILASLVLTSEEVLINRVPEISDVNEILSMIRVAGIQVTFSDNEIMVKSPSNLKGELGNFDSNIRASILLLGPLAARTGHAELPYPGGCAIGERPIDIHIEGLNKLGFLISEKGDRIEATLGKIPKEVKIKLRFPSVGATEHLMMTAAIMNGTHTELSNCAKEPEIVDLQNFLVSMGAKIKGAGIDKIEIEGVKAFHGTTHTIIGDRIEAGTYIIAALASKGLLKVNGASSETFNFIHELKKIGAQIITNEDHVLVKPSTLKPFKISTGPYPEFPTDLQPQLTFLACYTNGTSEVTEKVFENRFWHVDELRKMGASIEKIGDRTLRIKQSQLHGATLIGKNLRETATVLFAAAIADGPSRIEKFEIILRGYEKIWDKLKKIGVEVDILDQL